MKSGWFVGLLAALVVVTAVPFFASASTLSVNENVWSPRILTGPILVCTGNYSLGQPSGSPYGSAKCQDLCDLVAQIIAILYFIMGVGIWIILPIMFLWAGISIMLARGNPAKASEGRKALTGAVIGVGIMLAAYLIVSSFVGFFKFTGFGGFDGAACTVPALPGVTTT